MISTVLLYLLFHFKPKLLERLVGRGTSVDCDDATTTAAFIDDGQQQPETHMTRRERAESAANRAKNSPYEFKQPANTLVRLKFDPLADICIIKDKTITSNGDTEHFQFVEFPKFTIAIKQSTDIFFSSIDYCLDHLSIRFDDRLITIVHLDDKNEIKAEARNLHHRQQFKNINNSLEANASLFTRNFIIVLYRDVELYQVIGQGLVSDSMSDIQIVWHLNTTKVFFGSDEDDVNSQLDHVMLPTAPPDDDGVEHLSLPPHPDDEESRASNTPSAQLVSPYNNPMTVPMLGDRYKNCQVTIDRKKNTVFVRQNGGGGSSGDGDEYHRPNVWHKLTGLLKTLS